MGRQICVSDLHGHSRSIELLHNSTTTLTQPCHTAGKIMYYTSTRLLEQPRRNVKHLQTFEHKGKTHEPVSLSSLESVESATADQSHEHQARFSLESLLMSLHFLNKRRERERQCAALLVWSNDWVVSLAGEGSNHAFIDKHRQDHGEVKRADPQAMVAPCPLVFI